MTLLNSTAPLPEKPKVKPRKRLNCSRDWERRHESLFKQMHDKAFEQYAGMPWGG